MARTGRPRIEIPQDEFEKLCAIWCNEEEIAGWFSCSVDTLYRWCKRTYKMTFAEIYTQKASKGTVSIRRKQFELAQKGNVALLIWLGKQKLGQRDNFDQTVKAKVDVNGDIVLKWTDGDNYGDAPPNTPPDQIRPIAKEV